MFDLERHVAQWRREIEATLAFSPAKLDELEDHLRSAYESRQRKGDTSEAAWTHARTHLGTASALALEFAKDKLLPALGRLFVAWWKPGVLLALYFLTLRTIAHDMDAALSPKLISPLSQVAWQHRDLAALVLLALFLTVAFLPARPQKVGLLAGLGNGICLLPWLHLAVYNRAGASVTCPIWGLMWGSFNFGELAITGLGLAVINTWARLRTKREEFRTMLAVAATPVFFIALAPFLDGIMANLALSQFFPVPDPHSITYRGDALTQLCNWWFVGTLYKALVLILAWLPVLTLLMACAGAIMVEGVTRAFGASRSSSAHVFPAAPDLSWILALAAFGFCWVFAHELEHNLDDQLVQLQPNLHYQGRPHGGMEVMVVCYMLLYFSSAVELTRRLKRVKQVRPFYAASIVLIEIGVLIGLVGLPLLARETAYDPSRLDHSFEPTAVTWISCTLVLGFAAFHIRAIRRKVLDTSVSLWRFRGSSLVEFGCMAGAVCAWAITIFASVSLVLASDSVVSITAMLDWGKAIRDSSASFQPGNYLSPALFNWSVTGPDILFIGLVVGLSLAIILSALEFIRFNAFRLYRLRKIKAHEPVVALNE